MSQHPCSPETLSQAEAGLLSASSTSLSLRPTTPILVAPVANRKTRGVPAKTHQLDHAQQDGRSTEVVS